MAISPSFNMSCYLLCVSIILFSLSFTSAISLVSKVCGITQNPSQCNQVLGSNPRAAKADLKGLGYISIDIALSNAKQSFGYVSSLVKTTTDSTLKGRYDTCAENYDDTVDSLSQCKTFLDNGDISSFRTYASAALTDIDTCEDSFEGPPAAPAKLDLANKKLSGLISIVLAVGALLDGQ
ncbi:pectinesterase inhibitor-like [Impatiens glandulifera]|uniref:pectinesterase inhibitor-like n=1 Tax=Impatiens glandulifera TaxID=253017 RepID=UPI001FB1642F|nr:pectinesterase inhibitor-like [Impatiens glandulifera]